MGFAIRCMPCDEADVFDIEILRDAVASDGVTIRASGALPTRQVQGR
jgi:hypothetical protein